MKAAVGALLTSQEEDEVALLRELFGDPFRPAVVEPCWRMPAVRSLARAAYQERHLPDGTLDNGRLAVLADVLEEAGCSNDDLLGHLRGPGPHPRGCHAIDAVLDRE